MEFPSPSYILKIKNVNTPRLVYLTSTTLFEEEVIVREILTRIREGFLVSSVMGKIWAVDLGRQTLLSDSHNFVREPRTRSKVNWHVI